MLHNSTLVANLFRRQQYIVLRSSPKTPDIFSTDFQKSPHFKLHGNPSSGRLTDICEQTDRYEANRRFLTTF